MDRYLDYLRKIKRVKIFSMKKHFNYRLDLNGKIIKIYPKNSDVNIDFISEETLNKLDSSKFYKYKNIFSEFLNKDYKGCYAHINGKIIGFSWYAISKLKKERFLSYKDIDLNESFIFYGRTDENFRGQNIYTAMLSYLILDLKKEDVKYLNVDTEYNNKAAQRSLEKVGLKFLNVESYFFFLRRLIYKVEKDL